MRAWFAALVLLVLATASARAETEAELVARAHAIHDRVLTVDTHTDIPLNFATDAYDAMKPGPVDQQWHIPEMVDGGLDATFLIVYVPQGPRTTAGYAEALAGAFTKFAAIHRVTDVQYPDKIGLALTAADVRRIHASGRRVALIGVENGYPMGTDLGMLDVFYRYGARYFGLLHNGHNELGDSAQPDKAHNEPAEEHHGLTPLGRRVVQRLNQLGIMVDVSHSSRQSTLDMVAASKAPVIASHSGVKGVYDHPRNLSDDELRAIKRTGGVVQIVAFDTYLRAPPPEKTAAIADLRKEFGIETESDFRKMSSNEMTAYQAAIVALVRNWPRASVKDLVDHIDYAVK
jgi:membrane dipeptidase